MNLKHLLHQLWEIHIHAGAVAGKMRLILILLFTFSFCFAQKNIGYFNKANWYLKILKLNESELILYGDNGAIIRSYDAGETWDHDFSGTHSTILDLIYHNHKIYGLNEENQVMVSLDKGNLWSLIDLSDLNSEFNQLKIINDFFVLSSKSNSIFISLDINSTWQEKVINEKDSIKSIAEYEDELFVQFSDFSVKYSKYPFDNWIDLDEITDKQMLKKNEQLFFYDSNSIYQLKKDKSFEKYDFSLPQFSGFFPNENDFLIVSSNKENLSYQVHSLNKTTKALSQVSSDTLKGLDRDYYEFIDIEKFKEDYIVTNLGKTFLKYRNNSWEILSYLNSLSGSIPRLYDRKHLYSQTLNGAIRYSTDGGASFKIGKDFIGDTITFIEENGPIPQNNKIYNLFPLGNENLVLSFNNHHNTKGHGAFSIDNGETLSFIDDNRMINAKFLNQNKDDVFFYKQILYNGISRKDVKFYKININTLKIDSVNNIDSAQAGSIRHFSYNGKNIIQIRRGSNTNSNPRWIEIYEVNNDFSDFKLIASINEKRLNGRYNLVKYNNKLFLRYYTKDSIHHEDIIKHKIFNLDTYKFTEYYGDFLQMGFNIPNNEFKENDTINKFDIRIDTVFGIAYPVSERSILGKARFNESLNDFEYEFLDTLEFELSRLERSINGEVGYFIGTGLWMPIDEEHLYMDVNNLENGPPLIWTLSTYPNPATSFIKLKFYSSVMQNISQLEIELVNISTGQMLKVDEYRIEHLDNYNGNLEFDVSNLISGAYIINLRIKNQSMSEVFIKL